MDRDDDMDRIERMELDAPGADFDDDREIGASPLRARTEQRDKEQREDVPAKPEGGKSGQPPAEDAPKKKRGARRFILPVIALAVLGGAGWFGYDWWTTGRFEISTDDAYVHADFAVMAPKVSGYIDSIPVQDYAAVKAGDPLIVLEDGDYRIALVTAVAKFDAQQAAIDRIDRQIDAAKAAVASAEAAKTSAQATLAQAQADFERYDRLSKSDFASTQKLEAARAAKDVAAASVQQADAGISSAKADLAVVQAQRAEAEALLRQLAAARDQAKRDLDATVIRAPFDGIVGNLSAARGDYVTPGKSLLAVVPLDQIYVIANFKETEIAELTPGTAVHLSVDAFPDRDVVGHVVSLAPASGSVFSLLPVENATGNFTKVVQRIPVRISVPDGVRAEGWLRPGLSVVATADTRTGPSAAGTVAAGPTKGDDSAPGGAQAGGEGR